MLAGVFAACVSHQPVASPPDDQRPGLVAASEVAHALRDVAVEHPGELLLLPHGVAASVGSVTIAWLSSDDDLDVLCGLPRLETLTIKEAFTTTVELSCELPRLEQLTVAGAAVQIVAPNASLPALIELRVSDTSVRGIAGLPSAPQLRSLSMDSVPHFAWEQLRSFSGIEHLSARDTDFSDVHLAALVGLPLRTLDLSYTELSTLKHLVEMKALLTLSINGVDLQDGALKHIPGSVTELSLINLEIDPGDLTHLVEVSKLTLNGSRLPEVTRLPLPKLRQLALRGADVRALSIGSSQLQILDATAAARLQQIECIPGCAPQVLRLSETVVSSMPAQMSLTNLHTLTLDHTHLADFGFLEQSVRLRELSLGHTSVMDLTVLSTAQELFSLDIRCTDVDNLAPISELDLSEVVASGTHITAIPARLLRSLTMLDLYNTPLASLAGEVEHCALRRLDVAYTDFHDLGRLGACVELESLQLCGAGGRAAPAAEASTVLRDAVDRECQAVGFIDECI